MTQEAFRPTALQTSVAYAVTTSAAAFQIPHGDGTQVRLVNESTGIMHIGFGISATVPANFSATGGMSMLPSTAEVFTLDERLRTQGGYIYAIAATAGNLNCTKGNGV